MGFSLLIIGVNHDERDNYYTHSCNLDCSTSESYHTTSDPISKQYLQTLQIEKPPVDNTTLIYLDFSDHYQGQDGGEYFRNYGKLADAKVWNPSEITIINTPIGKGLHFNGHSYLWIPTQSQYDKLCKFTTVLVFRFDSSSPSEQEIINKENEFEVGYSNPDYSGLNTKAIDFAINRDWKWLGANINGFNYWVVYVLTYDGEDVKVYINGHYVIKYHFGGQACLKPVSSNWMIGARGSDGNGYNNFIGTFKSALTGMLHSLASGQEYSQNRKYKWFQTTSCSNFTTQWLGTIQTFCSTWTGAK